MSEDKRMAENYEITNSFRIGGKEVVFGIDKLNDNPYFCGFCKKESLIIATRETYSECMVGNDYIGMLELFADRVKELTEKVRAEWAAVTVPRVTFTADMCYPNDYSKSIKGQIVAIKSTVFLPEYQTADHQLVYITGGGGAVADPYGKACFGINLYNGKEYRYERYEVQGVVKPEHLPEWAKERLVEVQRKQTEMEKHHKGER